MILNINILLPLWPLTYLSPSYFSPPKREPFSIIFILSVHPKLKQDCIAWRRNQKIEKRRGDELERKHQGWSWSPGVNHQFVRGRRPTSSWKVTFSTRLILSFQIDNDYLQLDHLLIINQHKNERLADVGLLANLFYKLPFIKNSLKSVGSQILFENT